MKSLAVPVISLLTVLAGATSVMAQERIYRCGNEYTNNAREAEMRGCKTVDGGNVTIVQGTRPNTSSGAPAAPVRVASSGTRGGSDNEAQRTRDGEAKVILEGELRKAESRLSELQREYNNGEPERRGDERNYQKYLDRVAEMKANIARAESDVQGIRRELSRIPVTGNPGGTQ